MSKFLYALVILFAVNFAVASAEVVSVEGIGEYTVDKTMKEDINTATEFARTEAMRNASEKAGVHVRSYSRTKNFELDEDIIETISSRIIKITNHFNHAPFIL